MRQRSGSEVPIDHTKVIDGFGELVGRSHFVAEAEGRTGLGRLVRQARALSERLAVPQPTRA